MDNLSKLIIIESPYRGSNCYETKLNILYAKACVKDSLNKGEYPFASHLFYTQEGILDDTKENERTIGINAGLGWGSLVKKTAVYIDRGISSGMKYGIEKAIEQGKIILYRNLPDYDKFLEKANFIISENKKFYF